MDYWETCIAEAFEEASISATKEQIDIVASWAEGAHCNYGIANGYDAIPKQRDCKIDELERGIKELKQEHENQLYEIKKCFARRKNIDVNHISIDRDGDFRFNC